MQEHLTNQVAVVTGSGRGIGRAIALRRTAKGASVVLAARIEPELREIASGTLDEFHGLYLNATEDHDRIDSLRRRAEDIVRNDSRALRVHSD